MQVGEKHIQSRKIVGTYKSNPVVLYNTYGGLWFIALLKNCETAVIGASPHKAITSWFAEKQCPDIKWDRQALLEA
jgi:hypothetical protein